MTKQDKLERAIARTGAIPYDGDTWVYYADETRSWWAVDEDDLADLADYLDEDEVWGYCRWCAETVARELPDGWQP